MAHKKFFAVYKLCMTAYNTWKLWRFDLNWLKDEYQQYRDCCEIENLPDNEDKRVLKGIHKLQITLALIPSKADLKFLKESYRAAATGKHYSAHRSGYLGMARHVCCLVQNWSPCIFYASHWTQSQLKHWSLHNLFSLHLYCDALKAFLLWDNAVLVW